MRKILQYPLIKKWTKYIKKKGFPSSQKKLRVDTLNYMIQTRKIISPNWYLVSALLPFSKLYVEAARKTLLLGR